MKKVGQIFKQEREEKELSLEQIADEIKVPLSFLQALEDENYQDLPEGLYPSLYVRKYANYLDLNQEKMLAFFRRDYIKKEESAKLSFSSFAWGQKWVKYVGVGFIIAIFLMYLGYQYWTYVRPPGVKINLVNFSEQGHVLTGKTNPQATLKIDDEVILLNDDGTFTYPVSQGRNEFQIEVTSPSGRSREFSRKFKEVN
jgi:cytoskeletal protein RodZ